MNDEVDNSLDPQLNTESNSNSTLILDFEISEDISSSDLFFQQLDLNQIQQQLESVASSFLKTPSSAAVRIVEKDESQALNSQFRGKDKPTNVLSFPSDIPDVVESDFIGDIAICLPVVIEEAEQQQKSVSSHFTHMCLHGVLHLLGYDHIEEEDAQEMEALEVKTLALLSIDDPYQIQ